jgi:hypothetical protein
MTNLRLGFTSDKDNMRLKEVFKDAKVLKEMHMEIYPNNPIESHNPFQLFVRTIEKNVKVSNDGVRLILKKNDRFETHIANILLSDITQCLTEGVSDKHYSAFIVNIRNNIWYRLTILN